MMSYIWCLLKTWTKEQCFSIFFNRIASSLSFPYPQLSSALIPSHFSMGKCLSLAGQWDPQPPTTAIVGLYWRDCLPGSVGMMGNGVDKPLLAEVHINFSYWNDQCYMYITIAYIIHMYICACCDCSLYVSPVLPNPIFELYSATWSPMSISD